MPNKLPGDGAQLLPKGSDIVMQTHFHPSGKVEWERTEMAIYFADKPPSRQTVDVPLPPLFGRFAGLNVPAGEKNFKISQSITLPVDVEAISIRGHAHYICRAMEMTATLPDGEKMTLMKIDDWDLDWQDRYQFAKPVALPAGTTLYAEIIYDNSVDNPETPTRRHNLSNGAASLTTKWVPSPCKLLPKTKGIVPNCKGSYPSR